MDHADVMYMQVGCGSESIDFAEMGVFILHFL